MDIESTDIKIASKKGLKVAVVGCSHGYFDLIYESIHEIEQKRNIKVDLLLCCGDFESVRDQRDLDQLAGPAKYHFLKDFYKYYEGKKVAPIPTIFVGGNHEASNFLWELYYGGWVAKNIFYLGSSGVVNFGGLRIGGFSGVYKKYDFWKGHHEVPPFDEGTKRSFYHVRDYELMKMSMISQPLDVIMSHDWPEGVVKYGDEAGLKRSKPHFAEQIDRKQLGSVEYFSLLKQQKPKYWLSGHMHAYFKSIVPHESDKKATTFLALDKAEPRHKFLDIIEFPEVEGPHVLSYDKEWIAILKAALPLYSTSDQNLRMPDPKSLHSNVDKELKELDKIAESDWIVPDNFTPTHMNKFASTSPQTDLFVKKFNLLPNIYDKYGSTETTLQPNRDNQPRFASSDRRGAPYYPRDRKSEDDRGYRDHPKGSFGGRGYASNKRY